MHTAVRGGVLLYTVSVAGFEKFEIFKNIIYKRRKDGFYQNHEPFFSRVYFWKFNTFCSFWAY